MTSALWKLYVESSPDGCGQFFHLECGELTALSNGACGRNVPIFNRDYVNGYMVETANNRESPNNTGTIQIPESEADYLKGLWRKDCTTHIQRRNCKTGQVLHIHDLILNGESLSNPTAQGLSARDRVPVVTMPVRFRFITEFNEKPTVEVATLTNFLGYTTRGVQYCGCEDCHSNGRIWRVLGNDPDNPGGVPTHYLEHSDDYGETWTPGDLYSGDGVETGAVYDLHCYHGRVYLASNTWGVRWFRDPRCFFYFSDLQVNGVDGGISTYFKFASHGLKMYMLSRFNLVYTINRLEGVNPSITNPLGGNTSHWSAVDSTTTVYNDLAVYRDVVIAVGNGGVFRYSTEGGDPSTYRSYVLPEGNNIQKVVLYGEDHFTRKSVIAIMATEDNKIFKVRLTRTGETIPFRYGTLVSSPGVIDYTCDEPEITECRDFCELAESTSEISLFSILGGRGYWWGRTINGVYHYVFETGDGCATIETVDGANFVDTSRMTLVDTDHAVIHL